MEDEEFPEREPVPRPQGFDLNVFGLDTSGLKESLDEVEKHIFNVIVKKAFRLTPAFLRDLKREESIEKLLNVDRELKPVLSKMLDEKKVIIKCTGGEIDDKTKSLWAHPLMRAIRDHVLSNSMSLNRAEFYLPNIPELIPLLKGHRNELMAAYMRRKDIEHGEIMQVTKNEISEAFGISSGAADRWLKKAGEEGAIEQEPKPKPYLVNKYRLRSREHLSEK